MLNGKDSLPRKLGEMLGIGIAKKKVESDKNIKEVELSETSTIEERESLAILKEAKIEGDLISFPERKERIISTDELKENDLAPKYKIKLEGAEYNASKAFKACGHDVVICYVKTPDNKVFARSYYRSNSQGVWRYLPGYRKESEGNVSWLDKGMGEQQLTLPLEIQGALNEINDRENSKEETPDLKDMFLGTAKRIAMIPELYLYFRQNGEIDDALHREVQDEAEENLELFEKPDSKKPNPEMMKIPFEMAPDFEKQINSFNVKSEQYGDAKGRIFVSKNGEMKWLILEDEKGRACIASVQDGSEITSTGLRKSWINAGHFAMPLYEYPKQDLGMGDKDDKRGPYIGMWKNYLAKMPAIQTYIEKRQSGEIT